MGTLAFGSLIITICRMIRLVLEYIDQKLKKYADYQIVKFIMCCCKCCFWCLEKFLLFLNRNAYIMCAVHGKNFCTSAREAFMLLMRNVVRVVDCERNDGSAEKPYFMSSKLMKILKKKNKTE
ncbi:hypothetical protein B566_EDAN010454 [Ephemera danica]|nr:hypothetical protein B566_EDAN010454 [Ephemera danica]